MKSAMKRKTILLRAVLLACISSWLLLFPAPAAAQDTPAGEDLEIEKLEFLYNHLLIMPETLLYRLMENDRGFVLYDLREPAAYRSGHVAGAVNRPWADGGLQGEQDFPRDRDLLLISGDGEDALRALHLLVTAGYERVYSVEGGMENWMYGGYLVEGP